jgi:hypothetical protein
MEAVALHVNACVVAMHMVLSIPLQDMMSYK